jgi:N-acetylmuramoyl-L-alanine amidase
MVYPYLFPQISFQSDNNAQPMDDATPTPYSQSSFIFTLPTPTPIQNLGTPVPTFPLYPTPTPYQFSAIDDQPIIRQINIVLDPGHSKVDQGAVAPNGLHEETITYIICQKVQNVLTQQGDHFQVTLTRSGDYNQELPPDQRSTYANNQKADLFVSIHCGGLRSDAISRGAVYFMSSKLDLPLDRDIQRMAAMHNVKAWQESYYNNQVLSRKLASHVNQQLRRLYTITNIIQIDSNPRPGRFHLLRGLTMPGILIELGNLYHPTSAKYFNSERHQDDLANFIADAIVNYVYEQQTVY